MKKIIFVLSIFLSVTSFGQTTVQDSINAARAYNNANIVTNGTKTITAVKVNTAINRVLNAVKAVNDGIPRNAIGYLIKLTTGSNGIPKINVDSIKLDSLIRAIGGGGSLPQSGNYLISTGGASLTGNTVTIIGPITWNFNFAINFRNTDFTQNIISATSGKYRKDVIYINNGGTFVYVTGTEDDEVAIAPTIPSDGILVTIIDVFGSTITPPAIASKFQRTGVVTVNPATGNLTSDSTQFSYNAASSFLQIGATQPIGTTSTIGLNSSRFILQGNFNGGIINVGSGLSGGGTYDISKSISFSNRGNNYLKLLSTGSASHFADFLSTQIKNVAPITTNLDSIAVWEGNVLKKAALSISNSIPTFKNIINYSKSNIDSGYDGFAGLPYTATTPAEGFNIGVGLLDIFTGTPSLGAHQPLAMIGYGRTGITGGYFMAANAEPYNKTFYTVNEINTAGGVIINYPTANASNTNATLPLSVNGNFADGEGNITISTGSGGSTTIIGQSPTDNARTYGIQRFKGKITAAKKRTGKVRVTLIGDSHVNNGLTQQYLAEQFEASMRYAGAGWMGFSNQSVAPYNWTKARTGTWSDSNFVDGLDAQKTTAATSATITFTPVARTISQYDYDNAKFTNLAVYYLGGTGSFTISVDGVLNTTVTLDGTTGLKTANITTVTDTYHSYTITVTSGPIQFFAASPSRGTHGFTIDKCGYTGAQTSNYLAVDSLRWTQQLQALAPDAVVWMIGSNDINNSTTTFMANYRRLYNRTILAVPNADIIVVGPSERSDRSLDSVKVMRDSLLNFCRERNIAFLSLYDIHNPYARSNSAGNFADAVHFNVQGSELNMRALYNLMNDGIEVNRRSTMFLRGGRLDIGDDNNNTYIGIDAGKYSLGSNNVKLGRWAGFNSSSFLTDKYSNSVQIGYNAGTQNDSTANNVVEIGNGAGANNKGASSVLVGDQSGSSNQGAFSTGVGALSLGGSLGTGASGFGYGALQQGAGNYSTGVGYFAARSSKAIGSTAVGYQSLLNNTAAGDFSIGIGYNAGGTNSMPYMIHIGSNPAAGDTATAGGQILLGNSNYNQVRMRNYRFNIDQSVTASMSGYSLNYNATSGEIELQPTNLRPKISNIPSSATINFSSDTTAVVIVTALATNATIANPGGTANDGQRITMRIKDDGTIRNLTFGSIYRFSTDLTAPTATVATKTLYVEFIYNAADAKWDLINRLNNF